MPLVFLFFFLPMLEIFLLLRLASRIGFLNTFILVLATAFLGLTIIRIQGRSLQRKMQGGAANQSDFGQDGLAHHSLLFLAGFLLIIPGIITDVFGLFMLLKPFRLLMMALLGRRMMVFTQSRFGGFSKSNGEREVFEKQDQNIDGDRPTKKGRIIDTHRV